jgi:transcriptional regulator with XRE-family HTH domain
MLIVMQAENDQVSATLIRQIRRESGLKQVELARRSGLQSSVLSAYEHGHRQPSVAALARIAAAAGMEVQLTPAAGQPALERAGTILAQVLDLAEQIPHRPRRELAYPPLIRLAA